jgi:peptidoglycan L-alanyl-D-glutamate endopeptidase CwlK
MPFALSERDLARLEHVHPDLVAVVKRAASLGSTFMVVEGVRSIARQKQLVAARKSKTMNSRHIQAKNGFGHAVDIAPVRGGKIDWEDHLAFRKMADAMKQASADLGIPIEWGGDWTGSWDKPHFQLPWKSYPGNSIAALGSSRTIHGISAAATGTAINQGGLDQVISTLEPVMGASATLSAVVGWLKVVGVVVTLGGLAYAAYARWDDAGRPLPDFLRRVTG